MSTKNRHTINIETVREHITVAQTKQRAKRERKHPAQLWQEAIDNIPELNNLPVNELKTG